MLIKRHNFRYYQLEKQIAKDDLHGGNISRLVMHITCNLAKHITGLLIITNIKTC